MFSETRVQVADLNEDCLLDLVMSEAKSDNGRLAWFEDLERKKHILKEGSSIYAVSPRRTLITFGTRIYLCERWV